MYKFTKNVTKEQAKEQEIQMDLNAMSHINYLVSKNKIQLNPTIRYIVKSVNETASEGCLEHPYYADLKGYKTKILVQDEFKILANKMMEGIPCYILGTQIKAPYESMPRYRYTNVLLTSNKQIPELVYRYQELTKCSLIRAIRIYNTWMENRVRKYIKHRTNFIQDLDTRNAYYNEIMKVALSKGIKAYSPCAKTYLEVNAYNKFVGSIPKDTDISEEQIAYVECNARKFGLEIPTIDYHIASRKAYTQDGGNHGYTEEIQLAYHTRPTFNETRFGETFKRSIDQYMNSLHPANIPEEHNVFTIGTTKGQYKQVYDQLKYIESLDPETRDFFIAEGYTRCPHCGEITKKVNNNDVDIRCEYCDSILEEFVITTNNHLLYGTDIDEEYSNLDDIQSYLSTTECFEELEKELNYE